MPDLNQYSAICHAANVKWWQNIDTGEPLDRNKGELLMLIVSEVAEAMEGERKGLMDDKLPHRKMAEVELADALITLRILGILVLVYAGLAVALWSGWRPW